MVASRAGGHFLLVLHIFFPKTNRFTILYAKLHSLIHDLGRFQGVSTHIGPNFDIKLQFNDLAVTHLFFYVRIFLKKILNGYFGIFHEC